MRQELQRSDLYSSDMRVGEIRQFCKLPDDGQSLMRAAMSQLNLSARTYHRILKLARTIADLAGCEEIQSAHLAEALYLRQAEVDDELKQRRPPAMSQQGRRPTRSVSIRRYCFNNTL